MVTKEIHAKTIDDFVRLINVQRLGNPNKWYVVIGTVNGIPFKLKAYKTWLQIFKINGLDASNCMDETATAFKAHLHNVASRHAQ